MPTTQPDYDMAICEHHRDDNTEPLLRRDPALPPQWRVATCPLCEYQCEVNVETGEVRAA